MRNNGYLYSSISLFVGLLLQITPIIGPLVYWRPQFLLMFVIYWLLRSPSQYGIGFAWLSGMILDIFAGEMLGRYAIAFSFCAYILILLSKRLQHFGIKHQAFLILFIVFLNQLLTISISLLYRASWDTTLMIAPAITSAFLWPILSISLNKMIKK